MTLQKKEILCTLGPASRNRHVIKRFEELGVNLFRINLSHTKIEDLQGVISEIRAHSSLPICLDTEGAQVRTGNLKEGKILLKENSELELAWENTQGDAGCFNLYPSNIVDALKIGDLISIDFNSVLVQVKKLTQKGVSAHTLIGGMAGSNKAVTINRDLDLPPFTKKDLQAIQIGLKNNIKDFALSFTNRGEDVDALKRLVGKDVTIIAKIESIRGMENLKEIAQRADAILLDRGDMSREVPMEQIPRIQKEIMRQSKMCGRKTYVATNLLENMLTERTPTRAEVNDMFNTLADGADGLVLAAETAIGHHPIQCVVMAKKIIREFEEFEKETRFSVKSLKRYFSSLEEDLLLEQREQQIST